MNKNYTKNLKEFLDSGTTKAVITKVVLVTIALSITPFVVIGGASIGNAVQIFKVFEKDKKYKRRQISNTLNYLNRNKFIEYVSDKNGVTTVQITQKGESKIKSFAIDLIKIENPKKWDGKWRMVMFDLPIRYKKARNSLRFKLKQLGFIQFQKSVWVYPYPCVDEILFIADYYKVGKYVEILEVSSMLNDKKVKKSFGLL